MFLFIDLFNSSLISGLKRRSYNESNINITKYYSVGLEQQSLNQCLNVAEDLHCFIRVIYFRV